MTHPGSLRHVLVAGAGILFLYLVILAVAPGTWGRLLLPNGWLVLATALVLGRHTVAVLSGSIHAGVGAMVTVGSALLLVVFASLWPLGQSPLTEDAALQALLLVSAVPMAEELYFRGLLLPALAARWGGAAATALVSLLFAWLHLSQGIFVPMLMLSLALCVLTLLTGTTLWAVGAHLTWNTAALVREIPPGQGRWQLVLVSLVALTAIVGWGLATRRDRER